MHNGNIDFKIVSTYNRILDNRLLIISIIASLIQIPYYNIHSTSFFIYTFLLMFQTNIILIICILNKAEKHYIVEKHTYLLVTFWIISSFTQLRELFKIVIHLLNRWVIKEIKYTSAELILATVYIAISAAFIIVETIMFIAISINKNCLAEINSLLAFIAGSILICIQLIILISGIGLMHATFETPFLLITFVITAFSFTNYLNTKGSILNYCMS